MHRLVLAFINSMRALRHLAKHEKAVQQELILFLLSIPLAAVVAPTALSFLLLTGSVLFLIMIEVLNTGIEAACDAVSLDFHREIQIAKDCGSLAVLISIILVATVWSYTVWTVFFCVSHATLHIVLSNNEMLNTHYEQKSRHPSYRHRSAQSGAG